jgi:GDP-4-dehydro-6-deoxy-D-mannose reductase
MLVDGRDRVSTVLVTGAGGFVGGWVAKALLAAGHDVIGATTSGDAPTRTPLAGAEVGAVEWVPIELQASASVTSLVHRHFDAVVHLAAVSSGADARRDPGLAWAVNAGGTARLLDELGRRLRSGEADPLVVIASTGEVYGARATTPLREDAPVAPVSPYAASKAGAELAARETHERTGLRVIIARPFQQTGPGQDDRFVVPALVRRLIAAKALGARAVKVGNLEPVRDFLDVRDVAAALLALLERGVPGEAYNIATGRGVALRDLFDRVAEAVGVEAIPEADPRLMRSADIPYLVGDATKLSLNAGWHSAIPLDQTLSDLVASCEA